LSTHGKIAVIVEQSWTSRTAKSAHGVACTVQAEAFGASGPGLGWVPGIICVFFLFSSASIPSASHRTWSVTKCDENVTSHHFVTVPHSNLGPGSGKFRLGTILRRGGQPRARPRLRNAVFTDRPQTHKYQLAPSSASLRNPGMMPLRPPRGRSPHYFSVVFFKQRSSPHQNWKIGDKGITKIWCGDR